MHRHIELIVPLDDLTEAELEVAIETDLPDVDWQLGGRFRGAHEPGGPHPDLDVIEEDAGGLILRYSAGRSGVEKIGFFAMARPHDLIWLNGPDASRFLADGAEPTRWLVLTTEDAEEIDRGQAIALSRSRGAPRLALATIDVHE